MQRIKMVIAYDGTNYSGWQIQNRPPGIKTVQGTIEDKLFLITKKPVKITGAGRTDAGVHARGQVLHFDTENTIPITRFPDALNSLLPRDIRILSAAGVSRDFHARYSAKGKMYRYTIDRGRVPDVFSRHYAAPIPVKLNLQAMEEAANYFVGKYDFASFCASGSSVKDFVRTVVYCGLKYQNSLVFLDLKADGFLYNMVRIIAGTLIEVGKGKTDPRSIPEIIAGKDRNLAGPTAPPQGLCLERVEY